MDYLTYESFIHPDVLAAFLVKDKNIVVKLTADANAGDIVLYCDKVDDIYIGDKFAFNNNIYEVRDVDIVLRQIVTDPLEDEMTYGTVLTIVKERSDKSDALRNFYNIGQSDYSAFANSLAQSGVPIRFDSDVYILKRAFIAMYTWILQNKSFLRNINLTGIGIAKSDVYQHFFDLLESEKKDLEAMRSEAMEEVKRKQDYEANGQSGKGFLRYTAPNRTYFGGYRRR
jgi:hypothetical protein